MISTLSGEGEFEANVGILSHVTSSSGVNGILKQRYSDFIVREVTKQGEICRLKDVHNAKSFENEMFSPPTSSILSSDEHPLTIGKLLLDLSLISNLEMIVPEDELKTFLTQCMSSDPDCPTEIFPYQCGVKKGRTEFHETIKKYIPTYVEGSSLEVKDGPSKLKLLAKHKLKKSNKRERSSNTWPKDVSNFLEFTLLKENIDTMRAVELIARCLHMKGSNIGIAGTKDKRAVTTQRCTIYRGKPTALERLNNMHNGPGTIRLGDYKYVDYNLRLGHLVGNRFEIIIRDISASDAEAMDACKQVRDHGFINYYGLQRFGKGGSRSHDIGKQIYLSNWKLAVDMMFVSREGDQDDVAATKSAYQAGDYERALQVVPSRLYSERAVLVHLSKLPNDYCAAYHMIPKTTRLICAHAYQSYLWNMAASERIRLYGLQVVEGDVVMVGGNNAAEEADVDDEVSIEGDVEPAGDIVIDEVVDKPTNKHQKLESSSSSTATGYVIVTADDILSHRYNMRDVVLPIPGDQSVFPTHAVGPYMHELMARDGISVLSYTNCLGQYRTHGAYRRLLQHPIDFEWQLLQYHDPNQVLAKTELDAFLRRPDHTSNDGKDGDKAKLRALSLQFTMSPGTYATMLLREITKESTDTQYQAQLTAIAASSVQHQVQLQAQEQSIN